MPKKPKLDNINIMVHGKPHEAEKIRACKELCVRNGIELRDVVMDAVDRFLKEHHWPPGNSQTILTSYADKPKLKCSRCGQLFPALTKVECISGAIMSVCPDDLRHLDEHGLIKKRWLQ